MASGGRAEGRRDRDEGWGCDCGPDCFTLDEDGFTCHRVLDEPEVWRVELLMGDTFLPSVNAFVVLDGREALVVDTGTPDDYNDTRLMRALVRLGLDPARTTLFCTHAHIDHMGLARELALAGVRVVVGEPVVGDMRHFAAPSYLGAISSRLAGEGVPAAEAVELADAIWDHALSLEREGIPFRAVAPGEVVRCGRWGFEVVHVPGHTPGQCVLWHPGERIAFLGDAVLFQCSTCVCFWGDDPGSSGDPIGEQVASLGRLAGMGIERAFLGHGLQEGDIARRCLDNAAHHERRSARALAAIREEPGRTGFELVPAMGWHAPFDRWSETPALTRWFLVSESVAHLDHLVAVGAARRERDADGVSRYFPAGE